MRKKEILELGRSAGSCRWLVDCEMRIRGENGQPKDNGPLKAGVDDEEMCSWNSTTKADKRVEMNWLLDDNGMKQRKDS